MSEPVELDLKARCWIYRLWNADGKCLYVGQATRIHPSLRIADHVRKSWWNEVAKADYMEVYDPIRLTALEVEQIRELDPVYNLAGKEEHRRKTRKSLQSTPAGRMMSMRRYRAYVADR